MTIHKTIITVTILHSSDVSFAGCTLAEIGYEIDEGHSVGMMEITASDPVPMPTVPTELRALGNDGGFFQMEMDDVIDNAVREAATERLNNAATPDEQEDILSEVEDAISRLNNEGPDAQAAYLKENGITF